VDFEDLVEEVSADSCLARSRWLSAARGGVAIGDLEGEEDGGARRELVPPERGGFLGSGGVIVFVER